ncbi:MAG: ABC transporter permease [Anaerolineales bacterium]|nr:ABC transporter permease [Anaerolineales bacterium]
MVENATPDDLAAAVAEVTIAREQQPAYKAWKRFSRNKMAMISLGFVILEILVAVFANFLTPYDPLKGDYADTWQLPTAKHWLGTDDLGRDQLTRLIYGARISLSIGIFSQIIVAAIGVPVGALAGLVGGWFDFLLMRLVEILSSIPMLFFYILLLIALGGGYQNILLALAVTGWMGIARLVRGQVLTLKETDYVRAARAMGATDWQILWKHILPNSLTPIIVSLALGIPGAMFAEAGLSFIGLGIAPPTPSWGQMIGRYQTYIQTYWHLTVFPALTLALTMLAYIYLGDGLQDALDPTVRV